MTRLPQSLRLYCIERDYFMAREGSKEKSSVLNKSQMS